MGGKYPFDTKLSALNSQYLPLDTSNTLSSLAEAYLGPAKARRNLNFKEAIARLK